MYPLRFEPLFRRYIWGGRRLADVLSKPIGDQAAAESWEVVDHQDDQSIVRFGDLAGKSLRELIAEQGNDLIGKPVKCPKCSTAFKVGKKIKTKTNPAAPQAAKPQSPEEIAKANELKKFGLDGPISKSDAIFDESQSDGTPDPMANPLGRAGFDPGFSSHPPVEEKVDAMIQEKAALAESLLTGGAESSLTELNDDELLALVSLNIEQAATQ